MAMNNPRRLIGILVGGIGLMGAVYAWVAYATEIESDVSSLATAVSANSAATGGTTEDGTKGSGTAASNTLDQSAQDMLIQNRNQIENQHNAAIHRDMFEATTMAVPDELLTQHLSNYCSSTGEQGSNCPTDPLLMFGDLKISSILSGSTYNDTRVQAANAFLNTLFSPLDSSGVANFQNNLPITAASLTSNPALKKQYVQALNDEALLSVVRQTFSEMIAKRTPAGKGTTASPAVSEMQLMEKNAAQRFMSSTWAQSLATMTPSQMQAELALMQSYQLWMNYQSYRQMERVEALLAATLLQNYRGAKNTNAIIGKASTMPESSSAMDSGSTESE